MANPFRRGSRGSSAGSIRSAHSGFGSFHGMAGASLASGRSTELSDSDWTDGASDSEMSGAVRVGSSSDDIAPQVDAARTVFVATQYTAQADVLGALLKGG